MLDSLNGVLRLLPTNISGALAALSDCDRQKICEIRMRACLPLCISTQRDNMFVANGRLSHTPNGAIICTAADIAQTVSRMCEHSFYAYQNEINQGFITLQNGCRVGIAGTAVEIDGKIASIKNITSLNIRIARSHIGCSDKIMREYSQGGVKNTVIAGAPGSGKTTFLRDVAYQLSQGNYFSPLRVCAVDERYELFGTGAQPLFSCGAMCDRICGIPKHEGIISALRSLNPQVIVFDEMMSEDELALCKRGFFAGVSVITTVHAAGIDDFIRRKIGKMIIDGGIFEKFVFLGRIAGGSIEIMDLEELQNEIHRRDFDKHNTCGGRIYEVRTGGKML